MKLLGRVRGTDISDWEGGRGNALVNISLYSSSDKVEVGWLKDSIHW